MNSASTYIGTPRSTRWSAAKMFAVEASWVLIGQRKGHGHIRDYAGWPRVGAWAMSRAAAEEVRAAARAFSGRAPSPLDLICSGDLLAVQPLYALLIEHRWISRLGANLLGDAAHLMSPFGGEGVKLELADALDLAEARLRRWLAGDRALQDQDDRAVRPGGRGFAQFRIADQPRGLSGADCSAREPQGWQRTAASVRTHQNCIDFNDLVKPALEAVDTNKKIPACLCAGHVCTLSIFDEAL